MKCLGAYFVVSVLFLLDYIGFAQQAPLSHSQVDALLEEKLRHLSPREKQEFCEGLLGMKLLPECWKVASKEAVIGNINLMSEPLPSEAIDALERVFPALSEHRVKMLAATLLYRYDRPLGQAYLRQQLNESLDSDAAEILALNREAAALPGVVRAIVRYRQGELAIATGTWKRPEIRAALVTAFNAALKNKEQGYGNFFMPLAQQGAVEAIPKIRACLDDGSLEGSDAKIDAIAALIQLHAAEEKRLTKYLNDLLFTIPANANLKNSNPLQRDASNISKLAIIEAMGKTGNASFVKPLEAIIQHSMRNGGAKYLGEDATEGSVLAAQALAELNSTKSHPLIEKLILSLYKKRSPFLGDKVARALLNVAGPSSLTVLKNTMGSEWLEKEQGMRKLKNVPVRFLPSRGRLLIRKY